MINFESFWSVWLEAPACWMADCIEWNLNLTSHWMAKIIPCSNDRWRPKAKAPLPPIIKDKGGGSQDENSWKIFKKSSLQHAWYSASGKLIVLIGCSEHSWLAMAPKFINATVKAVSIVTPHATGLAICTCYLFLASKRSCVPKPQWALQSLWITQQSQI